MYCLGAWAFGAVEKAFGPGGGGAPETEVRGEIFSLP